MTPFKAFQGYFSQSFLAQKKKKNTQEEDLKRDLKRINKIKFEMRQLVKSYTTSIAAGMISTEKKFEGELVWPQHHKEEIEWRRLTIKLIRHGQFKIQEKIGGNINQLIPPNSMEIYFVVNLENLKPFEPSMQDDIEEILSLCNNLLLGKDDLLKDI